MIDLSSYPGHFAVFRKCILRTSSAATVGSSAGAPPNGYPLECTTCAQNRPLVKFGLFFDWCQAKSFRTVCHGSQGPVVYCTYTAQNSKDGAQCILSIHSRSTVSIKS